MEAGGFVRLLNAGRGGRGRRTKSGREELAKLARTATRAPGPVLIRHLGWGQRIAATQAGGDGRIVDTYYHAQLVFVYHHGIAEPVVQRLLAIVEGGHQVADAKCNLTQ